MRQYPTILVVEDDQFLRKAVCEFIQLIRPTWHTIEAANGQKGIELAETVQPDLIMTDLNMPVMDGYEMAMALQRKPETSAIPLILNTGEDLYGPLVRRLQSFYREIIFKPFLFDQLEGILERVIPMDKDTSHNALDYAVTRHIRHVSHGLYRMYVPDNVQNSHHSSKEYCRVIL